MVFTMLLIRKTLPPLPNFRLRDMAADHVQLSDPEAQFVGHAGPRAERTYSRVQYADRKKKV